MTGEDLNLCRRPSVPDGAVQKGTLHTNITLPCQGMASVLSGLTEETRRHSVTLKIEMSSFGANRASDLFL